VIVDSNERFVQNSFIERDIVEKNVWGACSNKTVKMYFLLLRVSIDSTAELFVVEGRPECVLISVIPQTIDRLAVSYSQQ
jgi:hypothetical protein